MSAYEIRLRDENTGSYLPMLFAQGADGKDAYAEAQKYGFSGTEEEFYKGVTSGTQIREVTLSETAWTNKAQTVAVTGVLAEGEQIVYVSPKSSSRTKWDGAGVQCIAQEAGKLTFSCGSVPSAAIEIYVGLQKAVTT